MALSREKLLRGSVTGGVVVNSVAARAYCSSVDQFSPVMRSDFERRLLEPRMPTRSVPLIPFRCELASSSTGERRHPWSRADLVPLTMKIVTGVMVP